MVYVDAEFLVIEVVDSLFVLYFFIVLRGLVLSCVIKEKFFRRKKREDVYFKIKF